MKLWLVTCALASVAVTPAVAPVQGQSPLRATACKPHFQGNLALHPNDDGRTMKLLNPYGFIDERCSKWAVPAGATIDGASIPSVFWPFIGGPFEGKYRNASVLHDWYCDRRTESWNKVHRMFYTAMLANGVDPKTAKLMYLAVYYKGPRWTEQAVQNNRLIDERLKGKLSAADMALITGERVHGAGPMQVLASNSFHAIAAMVEDEDLPLDRIDVLAEEARIVDGLSDGRIPPPS